MTFFYLHLYVFAITFLHIILPTVFRWSVFSILYLGYPILNFLLHWKIFGFSSMTIQDSLISMVVPINFISKEHSRTLNYLFFYTAMQDMYQLSIPVALEFYNIAEEHTYKYNTSLYRDLGEYLLIFVLGHAMIIKVLLILFWRMPLQFMYNHSNLSYPTLKEKKNRLESFPPDWNDSVSIPSPKTLSEMGHFFSHVRLTRPRSKCFNCAFEVNWENQRKNEDDIIDMGKHSLIICVWCLLPCSVIFEILVTEYIVHRSRTKSQECILYVCMNYLKVNVRCCLNVTPQKTVHRKRHYKQNKKSIIRSSNFARPRLSRGITEQPTKFCQEWVIPWRFQIQIW